MIGPRLRHGDRLVWAFDEDVLTAAWEAARHLAGLKLQGFEAPQWWWDGSGFTAGDAHTLELVETPRGPVVSHNGSATSEAIEAWFQGATELDDEAYAKLLAARDEALRDADVPMGASVTASRHDAVLIERMRAGEGTVVSWTKIGAGAAPSEFGRLQEAQGAYHVVMVDHGTHRTVGIWAGITDPRTGMKVRPALRRLLRQQGAWRYGIKYLPAD